MIQERIMRLLKACRERKRLIDRMEWIAAVAYQQGNDTYADRVAAIRLRIVYQLWDRQSILEFVYFVTPIDQRYEEVLQ